MRNNSFLEGCLVLLELAKYKVTLLVTFTTATGYFLFTTNFSLQLIFSVTGIFVLAAGSAALNQYQEKEIDQVMPRTKNRPIPSGRVSSLKAFWFAIVLILIGSGLLLFGAGPIPFLLGIFTLFWYNLVYTYLKRITAFAVVPGSVVGAIPPLVGWSAAGGVLYDMQILSLAFYLFIWQIPHFWLLLIMYGEDYERAGLPTLSKIFSLAQIKRLTFIWILATLFSAFLFAFLSQLQIALLICFILISIVFLVYIFMQIISKKHFHVQQLFIFINLYTLLVLTLSIINSINITL